MTSQQVPSPEQPLPEAHWRIFPCGDSALTIECAQEISIAAYHKVQSLRRLLDSQALTGVCEIVPAFTTLTLVFDIVKLSALTATSPSQFVLEQLQSLLQKYDAEYSSESIPNATQSTELSVERTIPVCYETQYAPDLQELASSLHLSVEEVIRLHTESEYHVAMLGFTPGFPYLLGLNTLLAAPRKQTPRLHVPTGAVGIAGAQTGIYPLASPGGWNIIGQTPLRLFSPESSSPTLFKTGDKVRFYAVSASEFERLAPTATVSTMYEPSNPTARVLHTGLLATVQDVGRFGWREYGVPQSGAADLDSLVLANMLVGNDRNDAALEILPGGFTISFERDTLIALTGASMSAEATLNGITKPLPSYRPVLIRSGATLRMKNPQSGIRSYLAFAGGIDTPLSLGSRSTYERARLGGMAGRALQKGDVIGCKPNTPQNEAVMRFFNPEESAKSVVKAQPFLAARWSLRSDIVSGKHSSVTLRIIRGAEYDNLTDASKEALFGQRLCILPNSDRMGLRLRTEHEQGFTVNTSRQLISRAVMPGTVQLPPDGQPIVLLADSQTTGGYPVIAHVISVDVPRAAQVRANDHIIFEEIALEEAQKLYIERERSWNVLARGIQSR